MKKEHGLDSGADVTLPIEGGHSDGRFGISEGYVITYSSIHISLLREKGKKKKRTQCQKLWAGVFCVFQIRDRDFSEPQADLVREEGVWNNSCSKSPVSISVPGQAAGWHSGLPRAVA